MISETIDEISQNIMYFECKMCAHMVEYTNYTHRENRVESFTFKNWLIWGNGKSAYETDLKWLLDMAQRTQTSRGIDYKKIPCLNPC